MAIKSVTRNSKHLRGTEIAHVKMKEVGLLGVQNRKYQKADLKYAQRKAYFFFSKDEITTKKKP